MIKQIILFALLSLLLSCCAIGATAQHGTVHSAAALPAGISNKGKNKDKPYVTAGDRSYIIGTMDGEFPDIGGHVPGEMGGVWMHPIKLLDGYYLKITGDGDPSGRWLSDADEFINYPYGNVFNYRAPMRGLAVRRFQYAPDGQPGVVIEYEISNKTDADKQLRLQFLAKTELSPVWFSKEIGIRDYPDKAVWAQHDNCFVASDSVNSWHAAWGSSLPAIEAHAGVNNEKSKSLGQGIACASDYTLTVKAHANRTIVFVVAGSTKSSAEAVQAYHFILQNVGQLLGKKKALFTRIANRAKINIPDSSLMQVYNWVKVNTQWLVRDVPGVGRGLSAGVMEYPWWFGCDNTYALQGVMETGDFALAKETLRLLKNKSIEKNGNGRIPHEISTNVAVANPGNTQETAHFIMCVEKLYRWTGDKQFLREMYPTIEKGLHWLLTDQDKNKEAVERIAQ